MVNDDTKPFPIQQERNWKKGRKHRPVEQNPKSFIPWWLAQEAYDYYSSKFGTQQSIERLAERGGFGREELLMFLRRELK